MSQSTAARPTQLKHASIPADVIKIGKDVIELLTSGMYVSPITIFREYVQNAADGIDSYANAHSKPDFEGKVSITIDHDQRWISIKDNGSGLSCAEAVSTLLAIGSSPKRSTMARGFRGVGRLSGLAYCRELIFKSKFSGENVETSVTWNCVELRRLLRDATVKDDLRSLITSCVSIDTIQGEMSDHSFEVILRDVSRHKHDLLLNERMIADYLGQIGPVAFHPDFSTGQKIEDWLKDNGVARSRVSIVINGEKVFRPFRNTTPVPNSEHGINLSDVEFLSFADVDGGVGAVAWIAHHEYVRAIPPGLGIRGLRGRVGDVQIGEANLYDGLFKEPRFNAWSIGEVHVLDRRIVPNARRDDFEVNHHSYNLVAQLASVATAVSNRCRASSISRNAEQTIEQAIVRVKETLDHEKSFDPAPLKEALRNASRKVRSVQNVARSKKLEAELSNVEAALDNFKQKPEPISLPLNKIKSLIQRNLKNPKEIQLILEKLEKMARIQT